MRGVVYLHRGSAILMSFGRIIVLIRLVRSFSAVRDVCFRCACANAELISNCNYFSL